jgi:putative membrane-bound dehydrogenase-like protein
MNRLIKRAARAGVLAAALFCAAQGAVAQAGEVSLFNGTDLSGWQGDPKLWRVENGEIVGSTHGVELKQNTFLFHDKEYADFELKVSFKLINGNSGIQFRSERRPDFVAAGYQADLAEKTYTGMLYEERKRGILPYWEQIPAEKRKHFDQVLFKRGEWNSFVVACKGDHVKLTLNGEVTCDLTDPEGAKRGHIALQLHTGPEMEVRFKDITIKDLAQKEAAAPAPAAGADVPKAMGPQTFASAPATADELLMPDVDKSRSEKLGLIGDRFRVPEGFVVEEVATDELIGSIINMTFDPKGRPALGAEKDGIWLLEDADGDGKYDSKKAYTEAVHTTMGMYYLGVGDLLVQADGPEGPGLYRLKDNDGDDVAEEVVRIQRSDAGMGEHGPHTVDRGPDGFLYIHYGNHAHPLRDADPASPYRGYEEDFLLPRYVDPRGHATDVMAPGGTIHRVHPDFARNEWRAFSGGFRNAYDFAINLAGEIVTFDSDMEWDFGLPWYRPVRVAHVVQGADYGWRTGSSTMPFYYFDTLPSIDDIGRGSPVGTAFYYHYAYPHKYLGAYFMGDWSRGRIRAMFPKQAGATYSGKSVDFVLGEPLNVTDLDVGPDGSLYFTNGGRSTHGGMYRVRYTGEPWKSISHPVVDQPMPRSAWGQAALLKVKEEWGRARWRRELMDVVLDAGRPADGRLRALEALQIHGPQPRVVDLVRLLDDGDAAVRAQAIYLIGASDDVVEPAVILKALGDADAFVVRRACEAFVRRAGVGPVPGDAALVEQLLKHLDHTDAFVRYAARLALQRIDKASWKNAVLDADFAATPYRVLTGLLGLTLEAPACEDSQAVVAKLTTLPAASMDEAHLLDYMRLVQLAVIRNKCEQADYAALQAALMPALLGRFPSQDYRVNRELQVLFSHFQEAAAISPMLAHLTPELAQEEQVHTVYCLRNIKEGWSKQQRQELVAWFDRGRELGGGASFEGYINNLWQSTLEVLPGPEADVAKTRLERVLRKRREEAAALMAEAGGPARDAGELVQMSFDELAEYVEYDPMAYREPNLKQGEAIFVKAKCAACHVFGTVGKGGGPDLSTVASRFRRRDILEAIMYPSKVVSDQYTGMEVSTKDGATFIGILAGENDTTLTMITAYGDRVEIAKDNIAEKKNATASIMPEGLHKTLSQDELVQLIQYLESGNK